MNTKTGLRYCIFVIFITFSINAQTIKDSLKYSELKNNQLSSDGKIALVRKQYKFDSKRDSIFIFNKGKLIFSKQTNFLFDTFNEHLFTSYNTQKNELEIFDTNTIRTRVISNVTEPIIIPKYSLVFFLDSDNESYKLMKVSQKEIKEIWSDKKDNINFINISDDQQMLLIQRKKIEQGIELINLVNLKKVINSEITHPIKQVIWSKKHPVIFLLPTSLGNNKYPYLTFYNYKTNSYNKQTLDNSTNTHYNELESTSESSFKLIQAYTLGNLPYDAKETELWSTNDRYLRYAIAYSKAEIQESKINTHVLFDYKNKKVYQPRKIDNYESINLDQNTLLVFDSNQYYDYSYSWSSRPRDISLYDVKNDTLTIITKQQESPFNTTSLSPKAGYFVYIKNNILHIYNINNRLIENTISIKDDDLSLRFFANRLRIWSNDERYFYFVSHSNLMRYDTKNKNFSIIIDSNNIDSRYNIINLANQTLFNTNSELHYQSISSDYKLLIQKLNVKDNTQALILLDDQKKSTILEKTEDKISDIKYSDDFKTITYSLENFNKPKTVYIYQNGKTDLLLDSKMPKKLYSWQKQKIITYKDKFGTPLKGILFYPKDFDSSKKYPMITHVYEIQFHHKNIFTYPTYLNDTGFNITLLQNKNYFVFLPDILDTEQGTGLSALHCVEQGLKSVLQEETAIDEKNIGIFGFSHGAYETNFIVTQTNIFKAAVSGAGNSDIVRSYFSYNENFNSPFYFQFENGQYKMPKTFSEDKELFLKNSPILFTNQIKTPILTFTGKLDENIHWEQQREFFIGMLRYNIPHVALFYKNEGHGFSIKENQVDITKRLINWFDYFLKNKDTTETYWVKYNTTFEKERMIN
ncbi:prolyl oligopeptidase family serine peptidase [Myroides sp. DF42-4-2]|uniref:alpha/beta hydrolase family protein n=1 Tax=Myroides sp. DF42-4-2 TaxID=2746726 RepID=UPI0025755AE1|nr:prolyl oligopeptidase family serine peptidase [Myroides sp. DF42-4-2]MDM1408223.1 S9 family peptidase [Myroides sp. DF42-4-2]